jgi:hypothetical protein
MVGDAQQRQRRLPQRAGALLLPFVNLAGAAVLVLFGLIATGLRCDDNCSIAPGWRNEANAWQWDATIDVTLVIFFSALVLNVALLLPRTRRLRWAAVLLELGALVFLTFLSVTAVPGGGNGGLTWLLALFVFFGATGVGAVGMAAD